MVNVPTLKKGSQDNRYGNLMQGLWRTSPEMMIRTQMNYGFRANIS